MTNHGKNIVPNLQVLIILRCNYYLSESLVGVNICKLIMNQGQVESPYGSIILINIINHHYELGTIRV